MDLSRLSDMGRYTAFFNDTGARYNPQAARQAWERALDWFRRDLGS